MTVNVLQGKVDQVCVRVNTDRVSVRHEKLALTHQGLSLSSKDGDVPGFSRYIQQSQAGVECEDIRVFAHWVCSQNPHARKVYDCELMVPFARNERKSLMHVKRHTVRMFDSAHRVATNDLRRRWIN